jgi:hypothetical protein
MIVENVTFLWLKEYFAALILLDRNTYGEQSAGPLAEAVALHPEVSVVAAPEEERRERQLCEQPAMSRTTRIKPQGCRTTQKIFELMEEVGCCWKDDAKN